MVRERGVGMVFVVSQAPGGAKMRGRGSRRAESLGARTSEGSSLRTSGQHSRAGARRLMGLPSRSCLAAGGSPSPRLPWLAALTLALFGPSGRLAARRQVKVFLFPAPIERLLRVTWRCCQEGGPARQCEPVARPSGVLGRLLAICWSWPARQTRASLRCIPLGARPSFSCRNAIAGSQIAPPPEGPARHEQASTVVVIPNVGETAAKPAAASGGFFEPQFDVIGVLGEQIVAYFPH